MLKEDIQVDNKHVKKHSASLVIREMQITAAVEYQYTLLGRPKLKKTTGQMLVRLWSKQNRHTFLLDM